MANKIQLRRGLKSKIPTAAVGEPLYTTDTHELFVGTGSGNVNMSGMKQYLGTAMSGTTTTTGAYSYSACPTVKVGDTYLNTSNGNLYECTTAGSGSNAKWTYRGCLKGVKGDTGQQGTTGERGPQGVQGQTGATGERGPQGLTGADGAKGERGANATIVIAASNSTAKSKAAADYTCSGSGNQSTITTALSALPTNGGKIVLLEGTYNISSAFTISKNVVFEGMGDGTQINVSGSLATCSSAVSVVFRDMKITANTISNHLYKGGAANSIILDNVTLAMTATEGASGAAAFLNMGTFTAVNSKIFIEGSSGIVCYAIADGTSSRRAVFDNCNITLDGTNGRMHVGRCYTDMNSCRINIVNSTDCSNQGFVGGVGNTMTGGELNVSNSSGVAWFACDALSYGSYFGVYITLKSRVTFDNANNYTVFVGCHLHNFTVTGGTNAIANQTV